MAGFLGRPSVSGVRRVARILGTLLGLLLLVVFLDWVMGPSPPTTIRDYLGAVVWLLIISGFVVGWFKDLAASLLVLGGIALIYVVSLLSPPGEAWPWPILIVPAIVGFLFLYVHLAAKKK